MQIKFLAHILYFFIRVLNLTYRYHFIGTHNKNYPDKKFVYALWHQNLIGAILSHLGEKFTMIISESNDGELVAVTCEKMGHLPVRGSSTRGGKKALIEIIKIIKKKVPGAISVDGPKGPPHIVKHGIIEIARLAKCPIIPLSPYAENFWPLKKSWDQFRIPKPFTKIIVVIGEPIFLKDDLKREDFDQVANEISQAICEGEKRAITFLGPS